jgi:hypothetical protein
MKCRGKRARGLAGCALDKNQRDARCFRAKNGVQIASSEYKAVAALSSWALLLQQRCGR